MRYEFTKDCLIGVEQIDEEHRGLFQLVGEVHDLLENGVIDDKYEEMCNLIERLKQYTVLHFRHEEAYMAKIGHPELEKQKREHAQFCDKVNEVDIKTAEGDRHALISDLLSYLVMWLYEHILGSDLLIGKLVSIDEWKHKKSYEFTDEYLTDIAFIDEEHKELLRIIGEMHRAVADDSMENKNDEIIKLLEELKTCAKAHIDEEEEYMEKIQYDRLDLQQVAHDVFFTRLEMMDFNVIDEYPQEALEELVEFLAEWISTHILQMDKEISHIE